MIFNSINDLKKFRAENKKKLIGLCHGVFDVLHKGHIDHFIESKKKCNILIASITDDNFVKKGPFQPFNTSIKRAKVLDALKAIDYVYINKDITPLKLIRNLKPNYYFKGQDYSKPDFTKNFEKEKREVKKFKGKTIITNSKLLSSTKILNNLFIPWNNIQKKYLLDFNKNKPFNHILTKLDELKNLEIDIIGEPIIDSYIYSKIVGLASKDPAMSGVIQEKERIAGGVISAALIASEFVKKVRLFSYGKNNQIRPFLKKNIEFVNLDSSQDIQEKTRYISSYRYQKILQLTNFEKNFFSSKKQIFIKKILSKRLTNNLIICDFGIGIFEDKILDFLNHSKIFKFLNVQTNSINFGSNFFLKYKMNSFIKYLSLDEREWLLGISNKKNVDIYKSNLLSKKTSLSITLGKNGSIYHDSGKQYKCPVFVDKIVDTTGSGDAYFILTALLKTINTRSDLIPFLGNVYAGMHTLNLANKNYPKKVDFIKSVKSLLNF
jgi:rfaE bifunctional protein nucleotidyltransferase chain/domain